MKKFEHIISLGFFCSPAMELERKGLRDSSYPFDWLISDFEGVLACLNNNFSDFLHFNNLYQSKKNKAHYLDINYKFEFFHEFNEFESLESQLPDVKKKYQRRILRFFECIKEDTLFIRYIKDQTEADYINQNFSNILNTIKKSNQNNEILFIGNNGIELNSDILFFIVEKDPNDSVARQFLEKNNELDTLLSSDIYAEDKKYGIVYFKT